MKIQWYPGHMAKAKRKMKEDLPLCDVIVEVIDSRCPNSSRNPEIDQLAKDKIRILLFNKLDLADDERSKLFMEDFHRRGFFTLGIDARNRASVKRVNKLIQEASQPLYEKNRKKGISSQMVRAMVLGIPNVGKSKFINKFVNKNKAKVGNTPGFTKGKQWIKIDDKLELLDTPGVLWPKFEDDYVAYNLAITGSIKDNVLPLEEVAVKFLEKLKSLDKIEEIIRAYNLEDFTTKEEIYNMENHKILEILEKRLGVSKNDEHNYEVISRRILKDYRIGKIGKFFLEFPETE